MSPADDNNNDPSYWREMADRALRLARSTTAADAAEKLKAAAVEDLERALALTAEAQPHPVSQQQQQPQPDNTDEAASDDC